MVFPADSPAKHSFLQALAYISPYFLSKELEYVSSELRNHPEIRKLHPTGPTGPTGTVRNRCAVVLRRAKEGPKRRRKTCHSCTWAKKRAIIWCMRIMRLGISGHFWDDHIIMTWQWISTCGCGSLILSETTSVGPGQGHPAAALLLVGVGEDRSHGLAMFEWRCSAEPAAGHDCGEEMWLGPAICQCWVKEDREVVKVALKESSWAYDYIPESLRLDREIAVLAFRLHRMKLPKQLLNDKDAVVAAAEIAARRAENPGELSKLSKKKLNRMSIANLIAEYELAWAGQHVQCTAWPKDATRWLQLRGTKLGILQLWPSWPRQEGAPDHLIMLCAVDLRIVFRLSAATQERHTCPIAESGHVTNLWD